MDETLRIIEEYNQQLYNIYNREELPCLSDNGYSFKGQNVLAVSNPAIVSMSKIGLYDYLNEVTDKLKRPRFNDMHAVNEIIVATADLKYRLGTIFLYHPYIVKLEQSFYYHNGEKRFVYEQSRNDARFNRELPIAFESLYKYWQRLSDYLLNFFPKGLLESSGRSYFDTPLKYIKDNHPELCESENFKWYLDFSKNIYPEFNKQRKFFVHTAGYDNQFFQDYLESNNNEESMILMDDKRTQFLNYFKDQLNLCMEGYFKIMDFLNEIEFSVTTKGQKNVFEYTLIKSK